MVKGETKKALNHLRDVVKQDTNHIDAYIQMGDIQREQGNPQQALKIHQSLTVRPNLSDSLQRDIHKSLALDFEQTGQLNKARQEAERVLKFDKKSTWANHFILAMAEKNRDWDRAVHIAKMIQKINKVKDSQQLSRFQVYQGLDQLEKGNKKDAEDHFNKAIKQAPNYHLPYLHLGDLYAEERNLVKAIENWEMFALCSPEEGKSVFAKIEAALFDLGRFSEVENFYKRILDKNPSNLDALSKLANVFEEKGEHQNALTLVEDALSRFGESIHARLMKLKLSLKEERPHELANQIDVIIALLSKNDEEQ